MIRMIYMSVGARFGRISSTEGRHGGHMQYWSSPVHRPCGGRAAADEMRQPAPLCALGCVARDVGCFVGVSFISSSRCTALDSHIADTGGWV